MAEHASSGPVELGAPMDYAQHQQTFAVFVALTKVGVFATIAIIQSLVLFGIASGGFWLGVLMLLLMTVGAVYGLVMKGSVKILAGVVIIGFVFMALTLG